MTIENSRTQSSRRGMPVGVCAVCATDIFLSSKSVFVWRSNARPVGYHWRCYATLQTTELVVVLDEAH